MKVNFNSNVSKVYISSLSCGDCFVDGRRSKPEEDACYIKVDNNNGYVMNRNSDQCLALNLKTGQLKKYDRFAEVLPVNAVVNIE